VLNVTPDSFSDGGEYLASDAALRRGLELVRQGADIIDVGGESTRPAGATYGVGYAAVSVNQELERVVPVIERLAKETTARISIDTTKPEVAEAALRAGASIVNDVSGGSAQRLLEITAAADAELVLMHNRNQGQIEGGNVEYKDVLVEVLDELRQRVDRAEAAGVKSESIWLDPGIGFAKDAEQSMTLLAQTAAFVDTGYRVLVGPSRKSFIAAYATRPGEPPPGPADRLGGTAAAVTLAVLAGAQGVRVHDVEVMAQAVRIAEAGRSR